LRPRGQVIRRRGFRAHRLMRDSRAELGERHCLIKLNRRPRARPIDPHWADCSKWADCSERGKMSSGLLVLSGEGHNTVPTDGATAASNVGESKGGRTMIKKVLATVIAAGALSVPLAGVALAEPPTDPGSNGQGPGDPPVGAPGSFFNDFARAKGPGSLPAQGGIQPGQVVKGVTPGAGNGTGPDTP
jgi:hypothetical protein